LIQPIGYLKCDICNIKEVLSDLGTEVAFISEYRTIGVLPSYVIEVLKVMGIGRHIIRMDHATYPTDSVKFISIIVNALRCAISPLRSPFIIISAHGTVSGYCILTYLYWFESMLKTFSLPSIAMAISLQISSPRTAVSFLR